MPIKALAIALWSTLAAATLGGVYQLARPERSKYTNEVFDSIPVVNKSLGSSVTIMEGRTPRTMFSNADIVGGGVIVAADRGVELIILTVAHVADEGRAGHIRFYYKGELRSYDIELYKYDTNLDLALLRTKNKWDGDDIAAHLADSGPYRGDEVWLVGAPGGNEFNISHGVISNKKRCPLSDGSCYKTDAAMHYGSSGGGAYNKNGDLIGIVDYVIADVIYDKYGKTHTVVIPGFGGVISWNSVGAFLHEHMRGYHFSAPPKP